MGRERIMLLGAAGFVGQHLYCGLSNDGLDVIPFTKNGNRLGDVDTYSLDITNPKAVNSAICRVRPDVIINTAGLISVKGCETEGELAMKLNAQAVADIANSGTSARVALMILISTDAVFSGNIGSLFKENDHPVPKNVYGLSKRKGEILLQDSQLPNQVVRTSAVIGDSPHPNGRWTFQRSLLEKLKSGQFFDAMVDAINSPTYVEDVVGGIIHLLNLFSRDATKTGVFHLAGPQPMSKYELAQIIAQEHGYKTEMIIPTNRDKVDPNYPPNTSLCVDKLLSTGYVAKAIGN